MINYKLYNKDCRTMVELPENSIHAVCTSPPYWGLRKYSGNQDLIWGDNHCHHEWVENLRAGYGKGQGYGNLQWETGGQPVDRRAGPILTNFCSLCGAWRGAFGLEPTPEMYIQHSVEILREIRRVLRKDGVVFYNIGDSYAGSGSPGGDFRDGKGGDDYLRPYNRKGGVLKPLDLCLIPERLAITLQIDGWWVRSIIIWHKANPMPESVNGWRWERHRVLMWPDGRFYKHEKGKPRPKEVEIKDCPTCPKCSPNDGYVLRRGSWRPTDSYEQILMLTKSSSYYCDAEAVREANAETSTKWGATRCNKTILEEGIGRVGASSALIDKSREELDKYYINGRNLRNVWAFPTVPYPGAHFAVFPEKLPELCIKAATPEVGVCAKCGAPWARVIKHNRPDNYDSSVVDKTYAQEARKASGSDGTNRPLSKIFQDSLGSTISTLSWRPTCSCNCPDKIPATVLDPFAGAGTTLLVAIKLGRNAVGYELSSAYCDMTNKRIDKVQIKLS